PLRLSGAVGWGPAGLLGVIFVGAARAALPHPGGPAPLDGLDAVTTWGAWHHWRSGGKSPQQARAAMEATVLNLLAAGDHPRG
ncbi:hypothetical protein ACFWIT_32530, partial [Streptomyces virginiae]